MKNRYKEMEDCYIIYLDRRDGSTMETYVDKCDFDRVINYKWKWCSAWHPWTRSYYAKATIYLGIIDGKPKYQSTDMNTFIMENEYGLKSDHISHNTLDNRRSNLRLVTISQNSKNRKGKNSNNKSGYRNVCWDKRTEKWMVQLQVNGKNKVLGKFKDVDEAGAFAEEMRNKHYGEFAGKS